MFKMLFSFLKRKTRFLYYSNVETDQNILENQ